VADWVRKVIIVADSIEAERVQGSHPAYDAEAIETK
jgi:hypothetical protein